MELIGELDDDLSAEWLEVYAAMGEHRVVEHTLQR
tara:strand:- start:2208 stop:2312 length:105 start_codon:yes stop_codon:yes gene_type:complete